MNMTVAAPTQAERNAFYGRNSFVIGLFGMNCVSGRAATLVPERWSGSWEDCRQLGADADAAGIDFMLPIGRWKGFGGPSDYHGSVLETLNWASAMLACTRRTTVFATVHAPLFNPIMAAKMMVTADQIGAGRFGLNILCGWNEGEHDMFGIPQHEHDERYVYTQEWLDVILRAWGTAEEEFDFDGKYMSLRGIRSKPKPVGGTRPVIMNAGSSPAGQAFAIRNCDAYFTHPSNVSVAETQARVSKVRNEAAALGRDMEVFTIGVITCRPTMKEALEYHHYAAVERADWVAIDHILAYRGMTPAALGEQEYIARRAQFANGMSGTPLVGDPDHIADELARLHESGLRGIALSMVNYLEELPLIANEVLPRLERKGLRLPPTAGRP